MNKALFLVVFAALPLLAHAADINVNLGGARIQSGNTTITFGDRDNRGYYWDGKVWRDPSYWDQHHGKGRGDVRHNDKVDGKHHCPPGQAKKGNC